VEVAGPPPATFVRSALRGGASQYVVKPFKAELHTRLEAHRRSQGQLEDLPAGPGSDQEAIDLVFSRAEAGHQAASLPKGLSEQSLELVRQALTEHGELSASECGGRGEQPSRAAGGGRRAELTGMARVNTRRYLEYLERAGQAEMRLRFGAGRPVKLFRLVWLGPDSPPVACWLAASVSPRGRRRPLDAPAVRPMRAVTVLGARKNASGRQDLDEPSADLSERFSDCIPHDFATSTTEPTALRRSASRAAVPDRRAPHLTLTCRGRRRAGDLCEARPLHEAPR
jgi:hypothetical protein